MDGPIQSARSRWAIGLVALFLAVGSRHATATDWPQYRGPNHDGSSSEDFRRDWDAVPPRVVWKKDIEPGWSSITVAGGRAFTQVNRQIANDAREVCIALDAATGAELWATPLDRAEYPDEGTGATDGPRSTPSVDGDRVYVLTSYLRLYGLRASDGGVVWSRDFVREFPGTELIRWQSAASPLVVGDLIFLNANVPGKTLMAVRKQDGVTVWAGQSDTMTHASPVYATLGGTPQVVFLTLSGLLGVAPGTGAVLWRHGFSPSATSTAASPVVAGGVVYASCAYAKGAWTARVTGSGGSFSVSQSNYTGANSAYQNHWATPVHHAGYLYGIVERSFRSLACFNLATRVNTWTTSRVGSGNPGFGSLIKVGGYLLILTEGGELVVAEPNPAAYTEVARYQALDGVAWNHPAFSNGRIYARSSSQIVALDVSTGPAPLPALTLAASVIPDTRSLRIEVVPGGGGTLDASAAARLELRFSPVVTDPVSAWTPSAVGLNPSVGGRLEATVPLTGDGSVRYFRVMERVVPP